MPVEQEIIELVQAGKIDEAIAKYEELNAKEKLLDGISKRKEVGEAISTLTEVDRNLAAAFFAAEPASLTATSPPTTILSTP